MQFNSHVTCKKRLDKSSGRIFINFRKKIIFKKGGWLYPAKDAFMKSDEFEKSYEKIKEFYNYIDPIFLSSFWRRVNT